MGRADRIISVTQGVLGRNPVRESKAATPLFLARLGVEQTLSILTADLSSQLVSEH